MSVSFCLRRCQKSHVFPQDLDGNFSETLSWLVEYQDPHVVSHPAAALAADLIWFRFAVYYFLRGWE